MCHSYHRDHELDGDNYTGQNIKPLYGLHLAFFLYNGVLILIEYALIGTILHKKVSEFSLPAPVLTAMVVGTALPIAHWFTEEYVKGHVYDGMKVGCPLVVPVN